MNTKVLITFLVIIAVGLGAYFLGRNQVNLPQLIQSPDPTANWKTFTNTKLAYSIKYPPNFTYEELGVNGDAEFYIASDTRSEYGRTLAPRLSIYYRGRELTPEMVAKQELLNQPLEEVELNNAYGVQMKAPHSKFDYYLSPKSGKRLVLRFIYNDFPHKASEEALFIKTLDQILSTFKFND